MFAFHPSNCPIRQKNVAKVYAVTLSLQEKIQRMSKKIFIFLLIGVVAMTANAQGFVETEYLSTSDMNDKDDINHGRGDMLRVKGRYTLPLSVSMNERQQPTAWSATLAASYATLNNRGEALTLNPDEILNASLNLSHTRPLSARWQLIASLGAGIYAEPNEIAWRSILVNGTALFAYQFSNNLSAGFGLALTNSYGVPMLIPTAYLQWHTRGNVKVQVDMNGVKASTMFGSRFGLELTAIEIDGMSAVRRLSGETKIYSSTMLRSSLSPTFNLSRKTKLRLGVGVTWLRTSRMNDRCLKDFFKNFSDDEGKYRFRPAMRCTVGISYGL